MRYVAVFAALAGLTVASPAVYQRGWDCASKCSTAFSDCQKDLNNTRAQCAADYAGCLGYNPFANGTLATPTACAGPGPTGGPSYTTKVYTAYTTYCPESTTLTFNSQTYTISTATTLVITECPGGCTISHPVYPTASSPPVVTKPSMPPVYPTPSIVYPPGETSPSIVYPPVKTTPGVLPPVHPTPSIVYPPGETSPSIVYPPGETTHAIPPPPPPTSVGTVGTVTPATPTNTLPAFTGAANAVKPAVGLLALGALAFL